MNATTQRKQTLPATTVRLIVMLYDGAIAALQDTLSAIDRHDPKALLKAVNMASGILAQLHLALDNGESTPAAAAPAQENGANLERIYGYLVHRLKRVSLASDRAAANEVLELLQHLYQSWREVHYQMTFSKGPRTRQVAPRQSVLPLRPTLQMQMISR